MIIACPSLCDGGRIPSHEQVSVAHARETTVECPECGGEGMVARCPACQETFRVQDDHECGEG